MPDEAVFCGSCGTSAAQSNNAQNANFSNGASGAAVEYNQQPNYQYASAPNFAAVPQNPTFGGCYKKLWQNYANFEGRARRSEYWYVFLMNALISLVILIPFAGWIIWGLYQIAILVPMLALIVRRLHDIGKEWYYIFFFLIPLAGPIIMLVWICQDSQPGANQFGENPKGINPIVYPAVQVNSYNPATGICKNCGSVLNPGMGFCSKCGTKV